MGGIFNNVLFDLITILKSYFIKDNITKKKPDVYFPKQNFCGNFQFFCTLVCSFNAEFFNNMILQSCFIGRLLKKLHEKVSFLIGFRST